MRIQEKINHYTNIYAIENTINLYTPFVITGSYIILLFSLYFLPKSIQNYLMSPQGTILLTTGFIMAVINYIDLMYGDSIFCTAKYFKHREYDYQFTLLSMYKITKHNYDHKMTIDKTQINPETPLTQKEYEQFIDNRQKIAKMKNRNEKIDDQYFMVQSLCDATNIEIK